MRITRGVWAGTRRALKSRKVVSICAAAAPVAIGLIGATPARAGVVAYVMQRTSELTLTGGTLGAFTANTSTSAAQTAVPSGFEAHSGLVDALESYAGPAAGRPPENTFSKKGQTTPDYSRGDSLVDTALRTSNDVAEVYLTSAGNASASGAWSMSAPLTVTLTGTVAISSRFANELQLINDGSGTVQAKYSRNVSIQDSSGNVVYLDMSPLFTNRSMSFTSAGSYDTFTSGIENGSVQNLAAGNYVLTISGNEGVFATVVPEPASLSAIALTCAGLIGRRRGRRRA